MKPTFDIGRGLYVMSALLILITGFLVLIKSPLFFQVAAFQSEEREVKTQTVQLSSSPATLVITDDKNPSEKESVDYIIKRMTEMKVQYDVQSLQNYALSERVKTIVLATEDWQQVRSEELVTFVKDGGNLVIAMRPSPKTTFQSMYQQLGIIEYGSFTETEGFKLLAPFFMLEEDTIIQEEDFNQSMLAVRIHEAAVERAVSLDGNPLLWTTELGEGQVLFFNGVFSSDETFGPFFTWMMSQTAAQLYPVVYGGVALLDGFPFPTQTTRTLHGKSEKNYYRQDWWLSMQSLEARFDLNLTAAALYPSDLGEETLYKDELELYAREIVLLGGEVALKVDENLEVEQRLVEKILGDYSVETLLLPSNQLAGNLEGFSVNQGNLPVEPGDREKWTSLRKVIDYGYQDVSFSPYSLNGTEQDEMMWRNWIDYLDGLDEMYSVPYYPAREVSDLYANWQQNDLRIENDQNVLTVSMSIFTDATYFHYYSEKAIRSLTNCEVQKIGENLYLVQALDSEFSIETE